MKPRGLDSTASPNADPEPAHGKTAGRLVFLSLCFLCVLCASVVNLGKARLERETQGSQSLHREVEVRGGLSLSLFTLQSPNLDYSNFKHNSQKHSTLECNSCHARLDNSATPRFPGHKACTGCHLAQFVTPAISMCVICHTDVNSSNPPLKAFPNLFKESFNVKFDHAQHNSGNARPQSGCAGCHSRFGNRSGALSIPVSLSAHNQCYSCHTPGSKSSAGREIASCGVCHDQRSYARTTTNARSFRFAFNHSQHGPGQRLGCADCHRLTAGAAQSRQVSAPFPLEHFPGRAGMSCLTCHNGKRSFGGDLAFKDCSRCHRGPTFKMPM